MLWSQEIILFPWTFCNFPFYKHTHIRQEWDLILQDPDILGDFSQIFFLKTISRIIILGGFGRKKAAWSNLPVFNWQTDYYYEILKKHKLKGGKPDGEIQGRNLGQQEEAVGKRQPFRTFENILHENFFSVTTVSLRQSTGVAGTPLTAAQNASRITGTGKIPLLISVFRYFICFYIFWL